MSDSIQLHGFWRSLGTYRVRIALALKGLNYSENRVNVLEGEQFLEAISSLNPQCTLPIMLHNENVFTQSLAIIEYIEECYPNPPLLPTKALDRGILRWHHRQLVRIFLVYPSIAIQSFAKKCTILINVMNLSPPHQML